MKSILPVFILSLISAVAIAQSTVQTQTQAQVQMKSQPAIPTQTESSVGTLKDEAGPGSGVFG